jgi:uncharacterized 2Fe-2S/4Fe-4S cluster protein (DUF4445 family)
MKNETHNIDFEPVGRRGECEAGLTLLDCARQLGVELVNLCGGVGTCGRCLVQILEGDLPEPVDKEIDRIPAEKLESGYRLACKVIPQGSMKIRVPPASLTTPQRTQVEGIEAPVEPEPAVRSYTVSIPPASLDELRADTDRLIEALADDHNVQVQRVDLAAMRQLSPELRSNGWEVQAVMRDGELVGITPAGTRILGMAVDLGTTKVAGYLVDLETGKTLASRGNMNPQIAYGEDVIARQDIAIESEQKARKMSQLVVETLNEMAAEMCKEVKASTGDIIEMVLVANTAMHHLLLQLPVKQLATAPYVPNVQQALDIKARDLGLKIAPGGSAPAAQHCRLCRRRPRGHGAGDRSLSRNREDGIGAGYWHQHRGVPGTQRHADQPLLRLRPGL